MKIIQMIIEKYYNQMLKIYKTFKAFEKCWQQAAP